MISAENLSVIMGRPTRLMAPWVNPLNHTFDRFGIRDLAEFLGHVGHESARLSQIHENLNYSSSALIATFGKYFSLGEESIYARKPQAIANRVYANRMGNGPEESGDGWRYRGKGLIQITGKENHQKCGEALGLDLIENPDLLLEPEYAALSAGWYWHSRNLDGKDMRASTKAINGGMNGYADRIAIYEAALKVLP
jgi:putative chitinase